MPPRQPIWPSQSLAPAAPGCTVICIGPQDSLPSSSRGRRRTRTRQGLRRRVDGHGGSFASKGDAGRLSVNPRQCGGGRVGGSLQYAGPLRCQVLASTAYVIGLAY
jgi:hypothetical protein